MNKLANFSDNELRSELGRRERVRKEARKNRSFLPIYREVDKNFRGAAAKARYILSLPIEQQDGIKEDEDGNLLYLDKETAQERESRLSRTASYHWNYDQWTADFYENGEHIGSVNYEDKPDGDVNTWENDSGEFMDDMDLENFPGYATWHPSFEDCWESTKI
jgi:hypothetical protein